MDLNGYFSNIFLEKNNTKKGIHFEQKITPDLLWCVAASVLSVIGQDSEQVFSDNDIRSSNYFNSIMGDYFTKPKQGDNTENEYNKVSSYQLGLLVYADVLEQVADRPKKYKVKNLGMLQFVATNDHSALLFLEAYVEKLLEDNGLKTSFEIYKQRPTQENYVLLKDKYWDWARIHTGVRTAHPTHSWRVFNKIFNLYAHKNGLPGQKSARVRDGVCPFQYLIYNKTNFRDVEMPTGVARRDFRNSLEVDQNDPSVITALVNRSKNDIKTRHPQSEVSGHDSYEENVGIHVHHIFPESQYPRFSFLKENLIALTPGQHYQHAHEKGNTQRVGKRFQLICLQHKLKNIQASIVAGDGFYSLNIFISILKSVFGNEVNTEFSLSQVEDFLQNKLSNTA